jgi:hypothetical protein
MSRKTWIALSNMTVDIAARVGELGTPAEDGAGFL